MEKLVAACTGSHYSCTCEKRDICKRYAKHLLQLGEPLGRAPYYIMPEACIGYKYFIPIAIKNTSSNNTHHLQEAC